MKTNKKVYKYFNWLRNGYMVIFREKKLTFFYLFFFFHEE